MLVAKALPDGQIDAVLGKRGKHHTCRRVGQNSGVPLGDFDHQPQIDSRFLRKAMTRNSATIENASA